MKTFNCLIFSLILCLLITVSATAQKTKRSKSVKPSLPSADTIIDKYLALTGADKACSTTSSMEIKGYIEGENGGKAGIFLGYQLGGDKIRLEFKFPDFSLIEIYDGKTSWFKENDKNWVETKATPELQTSGFCLDYKSEELYSERKVKGIVEIEGIKTYKVTFGKNQKTKATGYYDIETGLLIRWDVIETSEREQNETQMFFGDYRQAGDFLAPFVIGTVRGESGMVIKIEEYLFNVAIDESKFTKPRQ